MTLSLNDYINAFNQKENFKTLADIGRGIEREALRILPEGKLSKHDHYNELETYFINLLSSLINVKKAQKFL